MIVGGRGPTAPAQPVRSRVSTVRLIYIGPCDDTRDVVTLAACVEARFFPEPRRQIAIQTQVLSCGTRYSTYKFPGRGRCQTRTDDLLVVSQLL
jgi:hypothetical protein